MPRQQKRALERAEAKAKKAASSTSDVAQNVASELRPDAVVMEPIEQAVRERGVFTKVQRYGFDLSKFPGTDPQGGGIWTVEDCLVDFVRRTGTCDAFRKSRPRSRCGHWWAVAYTIDPPTMDEFVVPEPPSPPAARAAISVVHEMPSEAELARIDADRTHGGYTRFKGQYNHHLTTEFRSVMFFVRALFHDIAPGLDARVQERRGPKITPLAEMLFAAFVHAHMNWSFRRTEGFLSFLADPRFGFIGRDFPGYNLLNFFVRSPGATPILRDVMALTAEPFRRFANWRVAADGTGAFSNRFDDWRIEGKRENEGKNRAKPREHRVWFKAHAACDVDTLIVLSLFVTDKDVSEQRVLIERIIPDLVEREYDIEKFLADGGYNATEIRELCIEALDAEPYIPWGAKSRRAVSLPWRNKVVHGAIIERIYDAFKKDEGKAFKAESRYRVKVENLFSAIKTKYGGFVRSLDESGPENEVLLKCICHNVSMLLLADDVYNLGIARDSGHAA